ncbi:transporter substrate-binding domain-containing protein [Alcaligenaceae bacterium LF4-65]|uniref:Transporter substrate-binding domain-containing protein n=1 Tax=Zwartia hollandica TaxID=324606 RepID=A0A953NBW9_9BURK|nr:transporter substrate-binding domain-containing protein [Zwartia hollandica]MBZ1350819.1 transporter substrate-binding domain-containing protein [Zwartia hollandica]
MKIMRLLCLVVLMQIFHFNVRAETVPVMQEVAAHINSAKSKCGLANVKQDTFTQVICSGRFDIGVRVNYSEFGVLADGVHTGFEIDLARRISRDLGVSPVFVPVSPANRIALLLEGKVDLILATMGHIASRAKVIEFIEPHYYAAGFAVVAARDNQLTGLNSLSGKSICVPLGSYSNAEIAAAGAKLILFDRPDRMIGALKLGACSIIAHDEPLLYAGVTGPNAPRELREKFEQKFSYSTVPWGMAVRLSDGETVGEETLGVVLRLLLIHYHKSGFLVEAANQHGIKTEFLVEQNRLWNDTSCFYPSSYEINPSCVLAAVDLEGPATSIAPLVIELQKWLQSVAQLNITFPMLTSQASAKLFGTGLAVSLTFVMATILATLFLSGLFFLLLNARYKFFRLLGRLLTTALMNSPVILLLVLGYLVVTSFLPYNYWLAGTVGLLMIGLNNGSTGGVALAEIAQTMPAESRFSEVVAHGGVQLRACVINAVKASPVAAFIGVPDVLTALVHISSFTGERSTTFLIVTIFYILVVQAVVIGSSFIINRRAPR